MIAFYFHLHWFHIQYNFCSENYLLLLVYNNFLFPTQKVYIIIYYPVFDCFIFFSLKKISCTLSYDVIDFFFQFENSFYNLVILSSLFYLLQDLFSFLTFKSTLKHFNQFFHNFFWKFFLQSFFLYIKMFREASVRYYLKNKE